MKKILNWIFAGALAVSLTGLAVTAIPARGEPTATSSLIAAEEGVNVTPASDAANAYTGEIRTGLLIESSASGAGFTFNDEFSGTFETDFRVFTDETYEEGSYSGANFLPTYGVTELTFTFTDAADADNTFDVVFENDSDLRALPQVYVRTGGQSAGIYYRARMQWNNSADSDYGDGYHYYGEYNIANNETKLANGDGMYTYILDSTFANLAWYKDELVKESDSVLFGFDAQDMSVYVRSRDAKITVWDFSELFNDGATIGATLSGFENYTVSVRFTGVNEAEGAKMAIYSLCGEDLSGAEFAGTGAPAVKAEAPAYLLLNESAAVPRPYAFDLADKAIAAENVSVSVTGPSGEVAVSGLTDGKYADGASFTPTEAGEYTVTYSVTDSNNVSGSASFKVNAYLSLPQTDFDFDFDFTDLTVGAGNTLTFEMPSVSNSLISVSVNAALYQGETLVEEFEDDSFSYTFAAAGEYTLTYTVPQTGETRSAKITVSESEPLFTFADTQASYYNVGDAVEIVSATAALNGTSAACSSVVEFPDGTRYTNDYFIATQAGVYRIVYSATIGGVIYQTERSFVASMDASSMFEVISNAEIETGAASNYADDAFGVKVTTSGTGSIRYSLPVNFENKTRDDVFLEFYLSPETWGTIETRKVQITLTDTEDPNNYITIEVRNDLDMDNMSDVKASANGQILKGLRGEALYDQDNWGTMINHGFTKYVDTVKLSYDNATKAVYANDVMVIDLDNPLYFDEAFEGFTNGTAVLTMETKEVLESTATFMIKEIDGVSMDSPVLSDTEGPEITVDLGDYEELPAAAVGHPYPAFPATAYDVVDGEKDVKVNVYRKVNGVNVAVSMSNGSFTPSVAGEYTLVYSSTDSSGNASSVSYTVTALAEAGEFTFSLAEESGTVAVGKSYTLPELTARSAHGNVTVESTLTDPDGNPVELNGLTFVPEKTGPYLYSVKGTDYIGRTLTADFELTVKDNNTPVFGTVDVPAVAVAGEAITLPELTATDYSSGSAAPASVSISVNFNGEDTTLGADRTFTPVIEDENTAGLPMTVTYTAAGAEGSDSVSYDVWVVNLNGTTEEGYPGYVLSRFFYGEDYEVIDEPAAEEDGAKPLVYRTAGSGATLQYVRPMIAGNATVNFYMRGGADSVTVRLTDSLDSSIYVEFIFTANGDQSKLRIAGTDTEYDVSGDLDGNGTDGIFRISYNDSTQYLVSADAEAEANLNIGYVRNMPDGSAFNGFPSGFVNITIETGEVSGNADVFVSSLGNNQAFYNSTIEDFIRPMLGLNGEYSPLADYGETVTVYSANASDVLGSVTMTLSVTAPDGTVLFDSVAADTDRTITIDQYGTYRIVYTLQDSSGNRLNQTYPVYCVSNEQLSVVLDGNVNTSRRVGDTFTAPSFHVEGSRFTAAEIYTTVYVIDPDYVHASLDNGAYTFEKTGTYTVRIYAQDPDYNTAYLDIVIEVR